MLVCTLRAQTESPREFESLSGKVRFSLEPDKPTAGRWALRLLATRGRSFLVGSSLFSQPENADALQPRARRRARSGVRLAKHEP